MRDSKIAWTNDTWNPVTGCSKVSPGCANCYAETLATTRLVGKDGYSGLPWTPENAAVNVVLRPERLDAPLRQKKPKLIFVNSMSDVFHELIPEDYIDQMFAVMAMASHHTFQVLTKRPERMREYLSWNNNGDSYDFEDRRSRVLDAVDERLGLYQHDRGSDKRSAIARDPRRAFDWPLPNVWVGTSVENARWRTRIDELRATPAAVRFLSAEPLLGPLDNVVVKTASLGFSVLAAMSAVTKLDLTGIDWVIVGGESGRVRRPFDMAWARDIRDACVAQGAAFFYKQSGGLRAANHPYLTEEDGSCWQWHQYPGDLAEPVRIEDHAHTPSMEIA